MRIRSLDLRWLALYLAGGAIAGLVYHATALTSSAFAAAYMLLMGWLATGIVAEEAE